MSCGSAQHAVANLRVCCTQLVALRPFISRSTTSLRPQQCLPYRRSVACSALAVQLQSVAASARLNSMHGPQSQRSEDVGEPIDTILEPDQGDRDPYWCRLWPSAVALAQLILQQPGLVKGKRVCDIGCGLGLAGIAAALAGAREVVMLDREAIALQCSLLSAQACGLDSVEDHNLHPSPLANAGEQGQQAAGQSQLQGSHGSTAADRGSAAPSSSHNSAAQPQVRAELFDWTNQGCRGDYDVALACDVLYEHFSVEPVANIAPQLLNPKSGTLLLADPSRRTKENRNKFLRLLSSQPKAPMVLQESSEVVITMDNQDTPVQLQQLRVRQGQETVGLKLQIEE